MVWAFRPSSVSLVVAWVAVPSSNDGSMTGRSERRRVCRKAWPGGRHTDDGMLRFQTTQRLFVAGVIASHAGETLVDAGTWGVRSEAVKVASATYAEAGILLVQTPGYFSIRRDTIPSLPSLWRHRVPLLVLLCASPVFSSGGRYGRACSAILCLYVYSAVCHADVERRLICALHSLPGKGLRLPGATVSVPRLRCGISL
jgi:hypothetical protein